MLWWILFVVLCIFIYVRIWTPHQTWKRRKIPHDKPVLIVGSLLRVLLRKTSFAEAMEEICLRNKPHKLFGFYNSLTPVLMLRDPEIIKQVGIKEFDSFLDHQQFVSEELDPLFEKNVFALKGQKWRHMRSTLSPAFTSSKMRSMFVLMCQCADQFTNYFLKASETEQPVSVEMKDLFTRYANDIIASCAFGLQCDSLTERDNEFYIRGKQTTDFSGLRGLIFFGYNVSPFLMKLFKVRLMNDELNSFFRRLVMGAIKVREEQGIVRPDMIQIFVQTRQGQLKYEENSKKENDAGFAVVEESDIGKERSKIKDVAELTDDDLTAQALTFFFAGFDTSSTLMCHMANELAINPDIQQRLQAEIDETLENCPNGKITYEALTKMKYLDMVICETLRKWPASPITDRVCNKAYTVKPSSENSLEKEIVIQKGDIVWIPIYAIHRDPENFPNPDRFDPERFSDENKNNIRPYTYLPFGIGPRNCLGSRFALLETKVLFIYILSKFNIVVDKKTQIPLQLSRKSFNMITENGFWLGLQPRKKDN